MNDSRGYVSSFAMSRKRLAEATFACEPCEGWFAAESSRNTIQADALQAGSLQE